MQEIKFIQVTRVIGNAFVVSYQVKDESENNPLIFMKMITQSDGKTLCEWADENMPEEMLKMFTEHTVNDVLLSEILEDLNNSQVPPERRDNCEMMHIITSNIYTDDDIH